MVLESFNPGRWRRAWLCSVKISSPGDSAVRFQVLTANSYRFLLNREFVPSQPSLGSLVIDIGGLSVRLQLDSALTEPVVSHFREFLSEGNGLEALVDPDPGLTVDDTYYEQTLRAVTVTLGTKRAIFRNVVNEWALETCLRATYAVRLPRFAGLLLHSSAVVNGGRAFVFMGRSGAGKSTAAGLSRPRRILGDEITALRLFDDGARAYGTPFGGDLPKDGRNGSAPLAGMYWLVQSDENRVERLETKDALKAILPNIMCVATEPEVRTQVLQVAERFAREVPVYRLYFRKEPQFWEALQ